MEPEEGGGIDWDSEGDRMLVMKMVIKMADINTPTKSYDLHRTWTKRITEEFYQQVCVAGGGKSTSLLLLEIELLMEHVVYGGGGKFY